eukprot:maker-scaffold_5-snap-gene-16.6-mRNA-1 protein AED:0.22 eAED:0.22 QI:276/1/1/1/1/0.66/3/1678/88
MGYRNNYGNGGGYGGSRGGYGNGSSNGNGYGQPQGSYGNGGDFGSNLREISWDVSKLSKFEKDFYMVQALHLLMPFAEGINRFLVSGL